jgi:hypothetical protein
MKTVKYRETQQEKFKDINVTGMTVALTLDGTLSNSKTIVDYTAITVKAVLRRGGRDLVLFNETLKNLVSLSEWDSPIWEWLNGNTNPLVLSGALLAPAVMLVPIKFDFGGIINVDNDDELTIQVRLGEGCFSATQTTQANCFAEFDVIEGVGLEVETPYINSRVIEAGQSNPTFDLGENVKEILICNYDKVDFKTATAVLQDMSIDSDKWSRNDSYSEMIARNFAQFHDTIQATTRYQSFRIYSGYELDNVKLNLKLNSANVAASQNYVLWYSFTTSDNLVTKAAVKSKKFAAINNRKGQFQPHLVSQYK